MEQERTGSQGTTPQGEAVAVDAVETKKKPTPGIALCLSGGGYRAMLFHVGGLWRLNELGYLPKLARVSSVSGGSITAGVLASNWAHLGFDSSGVAKAFNAQVVEPLRSLASHTIDIPAVLKGVLWFGSVAHHLAKAYDRRLFHGRKLEDLVPPAPRFVFNTTSLQSGDLWRLSEPYMADYKVGRILHPRLLLSKAVAASSAFPPFLSPLRLRLDPAQFEKNDPPEELHKPPFTKTAILTDGGVYDNLGLETAKQFQTVLVSDGGGTWPPQGRPWRNWLGQSYRVLQLLDSQVRALRKRWLIDDFKSGEKLGTYWGIRTDIADYHLASALNCPHAQTLALAAVATRLATMDSGTQERLIDWGYAVCDAAMRTHVVPGPTPPPVCPYGTFK